VHIEDYVIKEAACGQADAANIGECYLTGAIRRFNASLTVGRLGQRLGCRGEVNNDPALVCRALNSAATRTLIEQHVLLAWLGVVAKNECYIGPAEAGKKDSGDDKEKFRRFVHG